MKTVIGRVWYAPLTFSYEILDKTSNVYYTYRLFEICNS